MFIDGFNFALSAIGFSMNSNFMFNIGLIIGYLVPGVIVGLLIAWLVREFVG